MAQECYNMREFWEAYSRFFFAASQHPDGTLNLATSLAANLPHIAHEPNSGINVLCLGVGVSTLEYPLLSALERVSGRTIGITGIDCAASTLSVSSALCKDLQRHFPDSWAFADFIKKEWPQNPVPNRCGRFIRLDLDGQGGIPVSDQPHWSGDYPSTWHEDLTKAGLVPGQGFDVVTAAFCFHHMHWWRPALCNALRLLRPGGLLLLSQVDGDVSYLDWNQPEQWLLQERGDGDCGLIGRMMERFWSHPDLRRHWLERPPAGAIRPWAQIDLIDRLHLTCLPGTEGNAYFARNRMRPSDVVAIMKTRGLSPFRRAKDHLGEKKYASYLDEIRQRFGVDKRPSATVNRIQWHAFQTPREPSILNASAVLQKFSPSTLSGSAAPAVSLPYELWEYELLEASGASHEAFQTPTIDSQAFVDFLQQLILSGTLCSRTPFGVIGQRLVRQEKFSSALCFANPLCPPKSLAELMVYMCLRQAPHLRGFSNSHVLLKSILPRFKVPVVFSYVRDVCEHNESASVTLDFHRYRSFLEMRFRIALPGDFGARMSQVREFEEARSIVALSMTRQSESRSPEPSTPDKHGPSFILPVASLSDDDVERFKNATQAVADVFQKEFALKTAHQRLKRSRDSLPHFAVDGTQPDAMKNLDDDFSDKMVESLYWLYLIPQWKETVIFPATYSNPQGTGVCADDSLILFYTEELSPSNLRHEYRKVSLMFDQLNMRRLATSGEEIGLYEQLSSLSHELSKQTSVLFFNRMRPLSTMFEVGDQPRTADPKDKYDWPEPLGKVVLPRECEQDVASWLVCPNPNLFASLRDYLVLWAGASGAMKHFVKGKVGEDVTLEDFINAAIQVARRSLVAPTMEGAKPKGMKDVRAAEVKARELIDGLPKVSPPQFIKGLIPTLDWDPAADSGKVKERVLNLCLRALTAGISNALQHTKEGQYVDIKVMKRPDGVMIAILNLSNQSKDNVSPSADGTVGVIRSCLRLMDKDTVYPNCESLETFPIGPDHWLAKVLPSDPAFVRNRWLTEFLLPCPASFRNTADILWLKSEG